MHGTLRVPEALRNVRDKGVTNALPWHPRYKRGRERDYKLFIEYSLDS